MNVTNNNEIDFENEQLTAFYAVDNPNERPKPEEEDGTVGTEDDEDEGDVKPYEQ